MNVFELRGFAASQLEGPRRHLALCSELRDALIERPRTAADTSALLGLELDRARLANALGAYDDLRNALAAAASTAAAMTVRARVAQGDVELTGPRRSALLFPPGDTGASPPLWLDGLACAVIARDAAARQYLANTIALDATGTAASISGSRVGTEPFWREYGRAFVALVHGQPIAVAHAQRARQQMTGGPVGVLVREALGVTDQPVLQLIEVVAAGARAEWPAALRAALERFHDHFASEEYAHSLPGYLPLGLLAVCSLAAERGFAVPRESPYLPETLLIGAIPQSDTRLAIRYRRHRILSADEAHWFLDLQGYPRAGRTHRLIDRDGTLLAHYDVSAAAGLPPASADFSLVEDSTTNGDPLALDAGQLLFLAETFASECPAGGNTDLRRARILLSDAAACIDAILARIPDGRDSVPSASIESDDGRALLAREPGRFRRVRLIAYRDSLRAQLDALDRGGVRAQGSPKPMFATAAAGTDDESQLRHDAEIFIEAIRSQALPLLRSFADDAGGMRVRDLEPHDEDYEKVFAGEAARHARHVYQQLWSHGMRPPRPSSAQSEIRCAVAPAGMLTWRNELSDQFPGGYRAIAASMNPHRVWLAWKYVEPGKPSGLSFDGLVWVDDHWAWFPKPYRHLLAIPEGEGAQKDGSPGQR